MAYTLLYVRKHEDVRHEVKLWRDGVVPAHAETLAPDCPARRRISLAFYLCMASGSLSDREDASASPLSVEAREHA
jgi:hypothetical protein